MVAIAQHETAFGSSRAVRVNKNPGGLMGSNGLQTFATLDEGIYKMAEILNKYYIRQGLTTIPQIGRKYAPLDHSSLNIHWVP